MKNITNLKIYKIIAISLCVFLSLGMFPQIAKADVLPMLNGDFYANNYQDLEYSGRSYIVESVSGEITEYTSPAQLTKVGSYENGTQLTILYLYQDENSIMWGATGDGWVVMDNLSLVYDSTQFKADNQGVFESYQGEYYSIPTFYLYTYPNSGDCYEYSEYSNTSPITQAIGEIYTDENGNEWGCVTYYYAIRNKWICLTDPTNASLDAGVNENIPSQASISGEDTLVQGGGNITYIVIVLVAVIVVISIILIVKTKKKQ